MLSKLHFVKGRVAGYAPPEDPKTKAAHRKLGKMETDMPPADADTDAASAKDVTADEEESDGKRDHDTD